MLVAATTGIPASAATSPNDRPNRSAAVRTTCIAARPMRLKVSSHSASAPKRARVERGAQIGRAEASGLARQGHRLIEQLLVETFGDHALSEIEERSLGKQWLFSAKAPEHHLPATVHDRQLHDLVIGHAQRGLK